VAVCSAGPVTCVTTAVSNVLQDRHVFGHQQAVFPDVPLQLDLVLVVRVYLDDGSMEHDAGSKNIDEKSLIASDRGSLRSQLSSRKSMETKAGVPEDNLTLVAWAFLPLVVSGKSTFLLTRLHALLKVNRPTLLIKSVYFFCIYKEKVACYSNLL